MAQDPSHFLNELPMWKLKSVASEFKIDVSSCRYKRDYVERIKAKKLTEEQVRRALDTARRESPADARESKKISKELEEIAEKPAMARELPAGDEKSVERHIDEALSMKPNFFEVDSTVEAALNRMIVGDFGEAIKVNREARIRCLDSFSNFQVYSAAVSIRAADELLARIPDDKGRLDPNLRTAVAAAKRTFLGGSPRQREEALESLEALVAKTYKAFLAESEEEENGLRELLADYESFGTRTEESRKYMQIAASARQAFDLTQYRKYLGDARKQAETEKNARASEIDNTFHIVRASVSEAVELGAAVPNVEGNLGEARKAFDAGQFRRAVDLLAAVARAADSAHTEKLRTERDLEAKQTEKVKSTVLTHGPVLHEAHSYGMDVREGLAHLENARMALARRDVVSAAVFARRVRDIAGPLDKDVDNKRLELGVIKHVEEAKCGKCGKESLYEYPNAVKKCRECGHTFSYATVAPPETPVTVVRELRKPRTAPPSDTPVAAPAPVAPPAAEEKRKKGLFKW